MATFLEKLDLARAFTGHTKMAIDSAEMYAPDAEATRILKAISVAMGKMETTLEDFVASLKNASTLHNWSVQEYVGATETKTVKDNLTREEARALVLSHSQSGIECFAAERIVT